MLGLLLAHMRSRQDEIGQIYARSLLRWTIFLAIWSVLPGISFAGHLGGFVTGYALARIMPTAHFAHLLPAGKRRAIPLLLGFLGLVSLTALTVAGVGARERLREVDSVADLLASSVAAYEELRGGSTTAKGALIGIRFNEVPPELEPVKTEFLRILDDLEKGAPVTPQTLNALAALQRQVAAWWVLHAPDMRLTRVGQRAGKRPR
jgi:hypothetical protein